MLVIAVPTYAHLVEPRILRIKTEEIWLPGAPDQSADTIRLLVFSDIHHNDRDYSMSLQRIRNKAKGLEFDAVLIAGDLVRSLSAEDIPAAFRSLSDFGKPVYVVLGNHDVGLPGRNLGLQLTGFIQSLPGVSILNDRTEILNVNGRDIWISGTSEFWQRKIQYPTSEPPDGVPRLILTHNPDVAFDIPAAVSSDLVIAGHTHGGQIRIPFVYQRYIPTDYPFDINLHEVSTQGGMRKVWVSSGLGMSGLTMRLFIPPRLDLITLHLPERSEDVG